ncbi:hypothetical protein CUMW_098160 [Citrus unshiu]|uniref:NB-ARC domain-containing protein n=1 Tax=Citrus unshiu TaxID=55188 RepID=A0A2H5P2L0_CITUN|nr:hypothetical protein CUMW_098160 [Citrus unshiu]
MANISSKIGEISRRLEELCNRRIDLRLDKIDGGGSLNNVAVGGGQRPPAKRPPATTCLPNEPAVYGRDEDKARVLKIVLKIDPNDDSSFRLIPIVGMGGIGKTTLAREVYNDKSVEDFDPKAWVCVSDDFDVLRISKLKLKEALFKKKYLIVLDDVWSKSYDCGRLLSLHSWRGHLVAG